MFDIKMCFLKHIELMGYYWMSKEASNMTKNIDLLYIHYIVNIVPAARATQLVNDRV